MQIHGIVQSLLVAALSNPMKTAIGAAGLAGGIHYGSRATRGANKPFALLSVDRVGSEETTAGVSLTEYAVVISVVVSQRVNVAGKILRAFHRYWDRLAELPALDPDYAKLVLIWPTDAELGDAEKKDLGKDIIIGSTGWTIQLSEHSPAIA